MDFYKSEFFSILLPLILIIALFVFLVIFVFERKNNTRFLDFFSYRWWTNKDYDSGCNQVFYKAYCANKPVVDACGNRCNIVRPGETPHIINPLGVVVFLIVGILLIILIIVLFRRLYLVFSTHEDIVNNTNITILERPEPTPPSSSKKCINNEFTKKLTLKDLQNFFNN